MNFIDHQNPSNAGFAEMAHVASLLEWYAKTVRPFLEQNAPERLGPLDNDRERLARLITKPDAITVCFLGHSGIGKSTLLNALVAESEQVLPAGGIGPLTAQATEVRYSNLRLFNVQYHTRQRVWQLVFVLERALARAGEVPPDGSQGVAEVPKEELDDEARQELIGETELLSETNTGGSDQVDIYVRQAKQMVTGDQYSSRSTSYLADALRAACRYKAIWREQIDAADIQRIERIAGALKLAEENRVHAREDTGDRLGFLDELRDHAAGFLSPLIARIEVGWPSDLLSSGVVLVDLPGVGIAQDAYRRITKSYVRDRARAVVIVIDRAGPTVDTIDLLRSTGYWDRLVGAADDPTSDPCAMIITVTKVDDVAGEEWRNFPVRPDNRRPRKGEIYVRLIEDFKVRMRKQIMEQLSKIGVSNNLAVDTARASARDNILSDLEIYPVSAPEYRKLLLDDDDDRSFLVNERDTGIPALRKKLRALGESERYQRQQQITEVSERLSRSVLGELKQIESLWQERNRAAEDAERVAQELEFFLEPRRKERDLRVGAFREFLDATVKTRVRELVLEAREVAQEEVSNYLSDLRDARWNTLRAAVRRGGTFHGSRAINLPDDIANYFQEPMAAVWSQKLLKDIRKRTSELASDQSDLVAEISAWASEHAGTQVRADVLANQNERIKRRVAQMQQVGKEAVNELREVVKQKLYSAIMQPIQKSCEQFVAEGNDIGAGVKNRILGLFERLAKSATSAAQQPAVAILQENFGNVRTEIQNAFESWGDPLKETADLIVERHEERMKRSDAQRRGRILRELEQVLGVAPTAA